MMHTTAWASSVYGKAPRTLRRWAARLGYTRIGRDYVLPAYDWERIASYIQDSPGRPKNIDRTGKPG
jgi:hypothetical protein